MASAPYDMAYLMQMLESNNSETVLEIKSLIHEILSSTAKETWLLYGLVEYYIHTNSSPCLDILTGIQEPHDKHFFDKIAECLKVNSTRQEALTLLGHVIRKQPSWLHKIANQQAMMILLKILKNENEIPTLMNAVLVLVTLLPIIPSLVSSHLSNIFEIFSRLASWNTDKPGNIPDIYILHLQVGVYALFHRLYGMYPCNFLSYLRSHYGNREHLHIFSETIRPMLERVRMHPLLVTASKEAELSMTRWKKMETHDIIMECAKVSLDLIEGTREEILTQQPYLSSFQSQQPRELSEAPNHDSLASVERSESLSGIWKLNPTSALAQMMQESSSSWLSSQVCGLPSSPAVQMYGESSIGSPRIFTPSPFTDPGSMFVFPATAQNAQSPRPVAEMALPIEEKQEPPLSKESTIIQASGFCTDVDPSLRIVSKPDSCLPKMDDDDRCDVDQEVSEIVSRMSASPQPDNSCTAQPVSAFCDSKANSEENQFPEGIYRRSDSVIHDDAEGIQIAEMEESTETSMGRVMDYVCRRIRFHSQCGPAPDINEIYNVENNLNRARSCPEIVESMKSMTVNYDDSSDLSEHPDSSGNEEQANSAAKKKEALNVSTSMTVPASGPLSTEHSVSANEHLLNLALPIISVSYCSHCHVHKTHINLSPHEILDRHILLGSNIHAKEMKLLPTMTAEISLTHKGDDGNTLKGQIKLLHTQLLFERYKREVHAERNRRLLAKAKKVRALEEQNTAMRDQLQLQERYIVELKKDSKQLLKQGLKTKAEKEEEWQKFTSQNRKMQEEIEQLKYEKRQLLDQLSEQKVENQIIEKSLSDSKSDLLKASLELQGMQCKVAMNSELKKEVERLNKELILSGELQQKYREKFSSLSSPSNIKTEIKQTTTACKVELQAQKQLSDSRSQQLDAYKTRVSELENQLLQKDQFINEQKNMIRNIKEEYEEQINAVKEKNQCLHSQSVNLISRVLHLSDKLSSLPTPATRSQIAQYIENDNQEELQEKKVSLEEGREFGSNLSMQEAGAEAREHAPLEGYLQKLMQSGSAEGDARILLQEMDFDTSDYIKRRLGFSHFVRRGSSIIGSAGNSHLEAKQKEHRVEDESYDAAAAEKRKRTQ